MYQGFAIVADPERGVTEVRAYEPREKPVFDRDKDQGELPEGGVVLEHRWLDKPTDSQSIVDIADKLCASLFGLN